MCKLLIEHLSENHNNAFTCLNHHDLPTQYAMLLLRMCALPKLNYILRTVPPSAISLLTKNFDGEVIKIALNVLKLNHVPESIMSRDIIIQQLRLPCRLGGFGLTSVQNISHYAYLDSLSHCLFLDNTTHKLFQHTPLSLNNAIQSSLDHTFITTNLDTHVDYKSLLPHTYTDFISKCKTTIIIFGKKSMQSCITYEAHKKSSIALRNYFEGNVFHTARLKCIIASGSSLWKSALPLDNLSKLSNIDYQICSRMNLGLPPAAR